MNKLNRNPKRDLVLCRRSPGEKYEVYMVPGRVALVGTSITQVDGREYPDRSICRCVCCMYAVRPSLNLYLPFWTLELTTISLLYADGVESCGVSQHDHLMRWESSAYQPDRRHHHHLLLHLHYSLSLSLFAVFPTPLVLSLFLFSTISSVCGSTKISLPLGLSESYRRHLPRCAYRGLPHLVSYQ